MLEAGLTSPLRESELLLSKLLNKNTTELHLVGRSQLEEKQESLFKENLEKRIKNIPLAYIIGEQYFYGRSFLVKEGVFIPRFDTETLVSASLKYLRNRPKEAPRPVILEWGVGSGAVIITLALEYPNGEFIGLEKDENAYKIAKINVENYGLISKIKLFHLDGFRYPKIPQVRKIDYLISNPPYIKNSDMKSLPKEVKHEPKLALRGGIEGLEITVKILKTVRNLLNNDAILLFEGEDFSKLTNLAESMGYRYMECLKDLNNQDRVLVLKWRDENR